MIVMAHKYRPNDVPIMFLEEQVKFLVTNLASKS
jgi:hypothetical protein